MNESQRSPHTLGEILLDRRSPEERVKSAARSAPFWVIAVTAHAIVAFVLGMVALRHEILKPEERSVTTAIRDDAEPPKIEERPEPEPPVAPLDIPTDLTVDAPEFLTDMATDNTLMFEPTEHGKAGVWEGTESGPDDLWSMSHGGKGHAGAIGTGAGSGPGAGAPKGNPFAGTPHKWRNAQKAVLGVEVAIARNGLDWLRRHQSPDGSWDCDGFSSNCDHARGAPCTGRGAAVFDAGVTGLALLAFLGYGVDSNTPGVDGDAVRRGLKYLKSVQDPEGCYGSTGDTRHTYAHACATIAMCEAYAATRHIAWRKSAEAAVAYVNACQNPYKAWRYGRRPGDNDSSVTGWMLMALKAAKDAGLPVNERIMKDGLAFVDTLTDDDTGRTGYVKKGELPVRPEGLQARWPATESEALTAVAMCSRIFCDAAEGNPLMTRGAELLSKKLPVWDESRGSIDMYYWYYGTLVMHQMGGENWDRWNKALKTAVIDHQVTDSSCSGGSWDPKDPWGDEGGRVYSTALMTLCLEVYYRYPKVFGAKRSGPLRSR